jgi:hypothetical protein
MWTRHSPMHNTENSRPSVVTLPCLTLLRSYLYEQSKSHASYCGHRMLIVFVL